MKASERVDIKQNVQRIIMQTECFMSHLHRDSLLSIIIVKFLIFDKAITGIMVCRSTSEEEYLIRFKISVHTHGYGLDD